jgi:hypothetical protein
MLVVPADWLAATDVVFFQGLLGDARPTTGTLTGENTGAAIIKGDQSWGWLRTWGGTRLIEQQAKTGRPIQWTVQAALLGAAEDGATEIDLHGTGGNGLPEDCTGYRGEDRSAGRWAREADDLAYTISFLASRGVTVQRILP